MGGADDAGIQRQSGSECGGACFHGYLPVKSGEAEMWVGGGGFGRGGEAGGGVCDSKCVYQY